MSMTIRVTDPTHEFFGRVCVLLEKNKHSALVRPLFTDRSEFLQENQYIVNESSRAS